MKRILKLAFAVSLLSFGTYSATDLGMELWELLAIVGGISVLYLERREGKGYEHRLSKCEHDVTFLAGAMDPRLDLQSERTESIARELGSRIVLLERQHEWLRDVALTVASDPHDTSELSSTGEDPPPSSAGSAWPATQSSTQETDADT